MPTPQWVTHAHVGSTNWTYGVLGKTHGVGREGEGVNMTRIHSIHHEIFRKINKVCEIIVVFPPSFVLL